MPEPRLEHQNVKIRQLIEDYRLGRMVIPEFQREYVWRRSRAPKLIDSLYRGFPISSLLLWYSSDETRARRRDLTPPRGSPINWLIDGQQRVITLSRTLSGDDGINVVFQPEAEEFQLVSAATRRDRNWFRVSELWDDNLYLQLRRSLPDSPGGQAREAKFEKVRRILDYEVPVVKMIDHSFDAAVNAFTRINSLGVKLKREDIESAKVAARHTGFIVDEVLPYLESLHRQGFTRLHIMHLFRACAFVARPDGRNRTPLHELERGEVTGAWRRTQHATDEALDLVRTELSLANMDILWSGTLLVPVIALCASTPPRERDSKGIVGWLATAALLHRYSGSAESSLDQDLRACRANDAIGALLTNLRRNEGGVRAVPNDFKGGTVDRGALLGTYVACHHRGLRDIVSGVRMQQPKAVGRLHIFPRARFPQHMRSSADLIVYSVFTSGAQNALTTTRSPSVRLGRLNPEVLRSQCIPNDTPLRNIDHAEELWGVRRNLLAEAFNDFLRETLPNRRL